MGLGQARPADGGSGFEVIGVYIDPIRVDRINAGLAGVGDRQGIVVDIRCIPCHLISVNL